MSDWTAMPVCDVCWDRQHPDKPSPRLGIGATEICCQCGDLTNSGIYVRLDRDTVPFPISPEPPENVRIVRADGSTVPLELTYNGISDTGSFEWVTTITVPFTAGSDQLMIEMLPAHTMVTVRFDPPMQDPEGRQL